MNRTDGGNQCCQQIDAGITEAQRNIALHCLSSSLTPFHGQLRSYLFDHQHMLSNSGQ